MVQSRVTTNKKKQENIAHTQRKEITGDELWNNLDIEITRQVFFSSYYNHAQKCKSKYSDNE